MTVRISKENETQSKNTRVCAIEGLRPFLSDRLYFELKGRADSCRAYEAIEEIRLRRDSCAYLTVGGMGKKRNIATDIVLNSDELGRILNRMCDGSLYAYSESIVKGYVSLPLGIRVGVCGKASVEGGRILGVYDISALNVRIPRSDIIIDRSLLEGVRSTLRSGHGVLIFSPPSEGKTTCLRSLCYELASGDAPMRVAVIDTREELSLMPRNERLSLDMLTGYPKAEGIRIATFFMNPEVIICDEIGTEGEALSIADAQNCGVPLIATTHGATLSSIMRRRGLLELHRARAFGSYISIRIGRDEGFCYSVYSWEEAERALEDNRDTRNTV